MKSKQIVILSFMIVSVGLTIAYILSTQNKTPAELHLSNPTDGQNCLNYPRPFTPPVDADLTKVIDHGDTVLLQRIADTTSWKTFVALSWPATSSGTPDSNKCIGNYDKSLTVWEHWTEMNDLLTKNGTKVARADNDSIWIPNAAVAKYNSLPNKQDVLVLYKTGLPGSLNTITKKADRLVDQNSNLTFYQVYYNESMVEYIEKGKLNTIAGQKNFIKTWPQLTEGIKIYTNDKLTPIETIFFSQDVREDSVVIKLNNKMVFTKNHNGAMMNKVAWKIMSANDDASRFYTREALIVIKDSCFLAKVGMVGFHVAHKTAEAPQWIWSSFEQVDNVPEMDMHGKPIIEKNKKYNYFNPDCATCPLNTPDTILPYRISQIARELPLSPEIKELNSYYQKQLSNNVWQYYELIGTQWPFAPNVLSAILLPIYPLEDGDPRPTLMSNSVFETFHQKSSCMSCHADAFILNNTPSDFVWGFVKVKK